MTAAHCVTLTICAFCIELALAASPVRLGDPFSVQHGQSVELADGVKLKFVDVTNDSRCPAGATCVWQGEAFVEIELQVKGQTARGSITTEHPDRVLLGYGARLLGLYPRPRDGEERPAKEYVAFLHVADTAPDSATAFAKRAAAQAAASYYVDVYTRSAKKVCADWQRRQLVLYIQDSSYLCEWIDTVSQAAYAVNESIDTWNFFFLIDNPQLRTRTNEPLFLAVAVPKAPKNAFNQVRASDFVILPCDVTLLDDTAHGCNGPPR
jgi:hypothetical protein